MSRTKHEPQVSHEELREQLAEEARRLRSMAAGVRARVKAPNLEEYIRTGRGPVYQRDSAAWRRDIDAAYAFDAAAARLEEALRSAARGL